MSEQAWLRGLTAVLTAANVVVATFGWWEMRVAQIARASERAALARVVPLEADRDALIDFMGLVVSDVERSVDRAGDILVASGEYARPRPRAEPPLMYVGDSWFVVVDGKCLRVGEVAP